MKEDVLEQIVDDYLKFRRDFTVHNVPFKPSDTHPDYKARQDSVPSDIDVIGFGPNQEGRDRVVVVTCKAWQGGFNADLFLARMRDGGNVVGRPAWKYFRELWDPKWAEAFLEEVERFTGVREFNYRIAVTKLDNMTEAWDEDPTIAANLPNCPISVLTLEEMWSTMLDELTLRPAASEMGRLVQLLKAAGVTARRGEVTAPSGPARGSDAERVEQAEQRLSAGPGA